MKKSGRIASIVTSIALSMGLIPCTMQNYSKADAAYGSGGTGKNIVEYLNRGISAINTGNGMLVSWRFLANDSDNDE